MQLSKIAQLAVIGLPAALAVAVLVIWFDVSTSPTLSEYIDSSKKTQEVQNLLTKYPNATVVERDYSNELRVFTLRQTSSIEYTYFERANAEENTARAVSLIVRFEAGTLKPTYFIVSCYDQLREDSDVRIEGASLPNISVFLKNENCPFNLRTIE